MSRVPINANNVHLAGRSSRLDIFFNTPICKLHVDQSVGIGADL